MKYFLGVFAVIILLIFSVVIIANRSDDVSNSSSETAQEAEFRLRDEADTTSARLVYEVRGEITGQNEHEAVRITVSPTQRKYEVLKGYEKTVTKTEIFKNNEQAYKTFLMALDKAGYGNTQQADFEDKTGACPLGNVFTYQFYVNSEPKVDSWSANCSDDGNFAGEERLTKTLFEKQIPEYRTLVRGVNL